MEHSSSSSSSSSSGSTQWQLSSWLVFAARCLLHMCKQLAAAAAAPDISAAVVDRHTGNEQCRGPHSVLQQLYWTADWVGLALQELGQLPGEQPAAAAVPAAPEPAAAGAAAGAGLSPGLSELLKQRAAVLEAIEAIDETEVEEGSKTAARTSVVNVVQQAGRFLGPHLLQQAQAFAESVCAALPLRHCCNNPGCLNLGGLSEAALVAGAGSRCSRCRACYYCSRECQLAAWPLHKPVCKRLKEAEAAAVTR
jgi:hypothetical protein